MKRVGTKSLWKRVVTMCLMCGLIFGAVDITAYATDIVASGVCGEDVSWTLDSEGTLTISGTGEMHGYYVNGEFIRPWEEQLQTIRRIEIQNGITTIGSCDFAKCVNLVSVTVPSSVTEIRYAAF